MSHGCGTIVNKYYACCHCMNGNGGSGGGGADSGGGVYIGEIRLFSFRATDLPFGWHFCNGARYLRTEVEDALQALSDTFKEDWGITTTEAGTNIPDLVNKGDGWFLRPIDGVKRQVGSMQEDTIRNIRAWYDDVETNKTSSGGIRFSTVNGKPAGAFTSNSTQSYRVAGMGEVDEGYTYGLKGFDASLVVPTSHENRPNNIGMTPAIYLGV